MKSQFVKAILILALISIDVFSIFIAFYASFKLWSHLTFSFPDISFYYNALKLLTIITIFLFWINKLYAPKTGLLYLGELKNILKSLTYSFCIILSLQFFIDPIRHSQKSFIFILFSALQQFFFSEINYKYSRIITILTFIGAFILISANRLIFNKFIKKLSSSQIINEKVLIYGTGILAKKLYKSIKASPRSIYQVIAFLDYPCSDNKRKIFNNKIFLGTKQNVKRIIKQFKINKLFIALDRNSVKKLSSIMEACKEVHCQVQVVPIFCSINNYNLKLSYDLEMPTLISEESKKLLYIIFKRLFDFIFALLTISILFPINIIIAILIKIESSGCMFFKQNRVGKDEKLFSIYKFRTLKEKSNPYAVKPKSINDPHITRIGKFLRKSGLDEIPQLINVLKGEMSIVGPRPEMPFIVKRYNDFQKQRLKVKPGITGVWQISSKRREAIHKNIEYDIYYIHNCSFALDLAIIWKTIFIFFKGLMITLTS